MAISQVPESLAQQGLKITHIMRKQVASLAMIAEALDEQALNFYKKYGFQQFTQYSMKLYLPMKSIAALDI